MTPGVMSAPSVKLTSTARGGYFAAVRNWV